MTNTEKDRKQKKIYGDIEALADARRALKNASLAWKSIHCAIMVDKTKLKPVLTFRYVI